MKTIGLAILAVVLSAAYFHTNNPNLKPIYNEAARQKALDYKQQFAFRCSPDLTLFDLEDSANNIPLLDGWGHYEMPVTTSNDSAHIYFEQGINMYYAFHIIESMASFKKAARFDGANAMIWWAQALAYGPNINDYEYAATPEAYAVAQEALA